MAPAVVRSGSGLLPFASETIQGLLALRDGLNAALAVYRAVRERDDVPEDIRRSAEQLLGATGDKRNSSFLEQLGIRSP